MNTTAKPRPTTSMTADDMRAEITALVDTADLRYFDASVDNINPVRTAGEMIRRQADREATAREQAEMAPAIRQAIELALPHMDAHSLVYTLKALRLCPAR